jgi:hypothetical protein
MSTGRVSAVIAKYAPPPASTTPDPDAPGMFRFARAGSLSAALTAAGFTGATEAMHLVATPWAGTIEERWQSTLGMIPSVRRTVEALPPTRQAALEDEVLATLRAEQIEGRLMLTAGVIIASGTR